MGSYLEHLYYHFVSFHVFGTESGGGKYAALPWRPCPDWLEYAQGAQSVRQTEHDTGARNTSIVRPRLNGMAVQHGGRTVHLPADVQIWSSRRDYKT